MRAELPALAPQEAWKILQEDPRAVLVDIRSTMEFLFVGHPVGAIHIPWMDEPEWRINERFVRQVRELMLGGISGPEEDAPPVILICRRGKRSIPAGHALLEDGFPRVYHVSEGFEGELDEHHHRSSRNGWRYRGLPWEQC